MTNNNILKLFRLNIYDTLKCLNSPNLAFILTKYLGLIVTKTLRFDTIYLHTKFIRIPYSLKLKKRLPKLI